MWTTEVQQIRGGEEENAETLIIRSLTLAAVDFLEIPEQYEDCGGLFPCLTALRTEL